MEKKQEKASSELISVQFPVYTEKIYKGDQDYKAAVVLKHNKKRIRMSISFSGNGQKGSRLGTSTMMVESVNVDEMNSLCQWTLQYVGCVWIRQTSCFIQRIELNEMVP